MSHSASQSGSRSRSPSEDSLALPNHLPPPDDHASYEREAARPPSDAASHRFAAAPVVAVSLFIGLGPAARTIKMEDLKRVLQNAASNPDLVLDVRMRGRCAFADIATREEADRLIAALDGQMFEDKARMAVQVSERRPDDPALRRLNGRTSLFVGLGPDGGSISDDEIRAKLGEVAPIVMLRRREQCAFVDVPTPEDAEKMLRVMNNQYIGNARLVVQYSRENTMRKRIERRPLRGLDDRRRGRRDRTRSRSHSMERRTRRSRRSTSRDRRRSTRRGDRRRSHSRSVSSSRSNSPYSSDRSRGPAGRRSRSYSSSRASSASNWRRDRRDRRDRRGGGMERRRATGGSRRS